MALELSAHMKVRPGQLEGFKKQAAECIRITKEKDTHTLRYDWFLSSDGECEVREAYTDPGGLIEHNKNILEARTKLFKDYADNHFMTFYSEPVPEIVDLAKNYTWKVSSSGSRSSKGFVATLLPRRSHEQTTEAGCRRLHRRHRCRSTHSSRAGEPSH